MGNNSKGFSLLEVLISLVIMSIMMLGLFNMVDNGQRSKDSVTSEDQDYMQAQLALSRIDTDFSQIYSPLYYSALKKNDPNARAEEQDDDEIATKFTPTEQFPEVTVANHPIPVIQNPEKHTLIFFSSSNRRKFQDAKEGRWSWIQYTLRSKQDKTNEKTIDAGYELVRLAMPRDPFAENIDWDKVKEQLLLKNVKSMLYEFWDRKREKWVDGLKDTPAEDQKTPRALRVTLEWMDVSGILHKNVRVFRPLWPFFDTVKDELEKLPPKAGGLNPSEEDEDNLEDDDKK